MSKQYLMYFSLVLLAFLIIAPGIAAADGTYTNVTVSEAKSMSEEGDVFILDVRTLDEFNAAHIEGAKLIPYANLKNPANETQLPPSELLESRLGELPDDKNTKILVYCKTGSRSLKACNLLVTKGGYTNVYNMQGGIKDWIDKGYPVVITFVDELDYIDDSTRTALNSKLNNVLCHMEKGEDSKAMEKIDKFICFVGEMEKECRLGSDEATYLIHEASIHLEDLI